MANIIDPNTPLREAASGYLLAQCARLEKHLAGVRDNRDPEDLHDVRVAARRIRSAMSVLEACFTKKQFRRWYGLLSDLADALSETRDQDVQMELIGSLRDGLSPDHHGFVDLWLQERQELRAGSRRKMLDLLDQWESEGALAGLKETFASLASPHERLADEAARIESALMPDIAPETANV